MCSTFMCQLKIKGIKKKVLTIQVFENLSRLTSVSVSFLVTLNSIPLQCIVIICLQLHFLGESLRAFEGQERMSLSIKYWDHCLSKVVMKYIFGCIFNDKENSLCFLTNLFLLWKLYSGPPFTDSWNSLIWYCSLFFPPSLPEGCTHPAERGRELRSGLSCSGLFDKLLKMTGLGKFSGCSATALTPLQFEANMGKTICLFLVG